MPRKRANRDAWVFWLPVYENLFRRSKEREVEVAVDRESLAVCPGLRRSDFSTNCHGMTKPTSLH